MASKKANTTISVQAALLLVLATIIMTAAVVLSVVRSNQTDSEAARGGGGGKKGVTYGSCSVSPNPTPVKTQFTISGSGFKASQFLTLKIQNSAGVGFLWTQADASGNLSQTSQSYYTGTVTISVYDSVTSSQTALTSCSVLIT